MTVSILTVEGLCNAALDRIGYPVSITQMREGTRHAKVALQIYGQARDALLQSKSWQFAQRSAALTLTAFQIAPWPYEYAWPADCLMPRMVVPTPIPYPNLSPQDVLWTVGNDVRVTPSNVILTGQASASLIYTAQVVDPSQWEAGFAEALIDELAAAFVPALGDMRTLPAAVERAGDALNEGVASTTLQPPDDAAAARAEARQ
jgi:hypothetical protein